MQVPATWKVTDEAGSFYHSHFEYYQATVHLLSLARATESYASRQPIASQRVDTQPTQKPSLLSP